MIDVGQIEELSCKYDELVVQLYHDFQGLSGLHGDFIEDCIESIEEKKRKEGRLPVGEMFPLIVADGMAIASDRRRQLAAGCLALHGYTRLVDKELDERGALNARSSMAASALLGWGIATLSRETAGTRYADMFVSNVTAALSAQHDDLQYRSDLKHDRTESDINKNRAIVATVAAFCAASGTMDDRLIKTTELLLGPFQRLDDLADLPEDILEKNLTWFAKIAHELAPSADALRSMDASDMYKLLLMDQRATHELHRIAIALREAISLLEEPTDSDLLVYLTYLHESVLNLVSSITDFRTSGTGSISGLERQIRALRVDV
jgi:hypothetical protein